MGMAEIFCWENCRRANEIRQTMADPLNKIDMMALALKT